MTVRSPFRGNINSASAEQHGTAEEQLFEDRVSSLHFRSAGELGGLPDYTGRLTQLRDERFHIGHFIVRLPDEVQWSPEMFEICGLPPRAGPLSLVDVIEPFDGEDRAKLADLIKESLTDRLGYQATLRLRRPDGTVRLVEVVGDVVVAGGSLTALVGLMRDVTSAAHPEEERPHQDPIRRIIESMPVPALLTDPQMRILAHSEPWARSHGIARNVIGEDLVSAVYKAPPGWALEHARAVAGERVTAERLFYNPATNRPAKCITTLTPWIDRGGATRGVVTVIGGSDFTFASKDIAIQAKRR